MGATRPIPGAAQRWRTAGFLWLILTVLVYLAVIVVRLETVPESDDPWEAVADGSLAVDLLFASLLVSPTVIALWVADRRARRDDAGHHPENSHRD